MKNIFLLLMTIGILTSCSEDEISYEKEKILNEPTLKAAFNPNYNVLGYGYDITESYTSKNAIQFRVINIDSLIKNESSSNFYFSDEPIDETDFRYFSGEDYKKYTENIITKTNFNASVASNAISITPLKKGIFSTDAKYKRETESKFTYSSKYSFATVDVIRRYKKILIHTDVDILCKYFDDYFKRQIDNLSTASQADEIIKLYGTHVLLNITTGGYFRALSRAVIIEETNYNRKKEIAEAVGKFHLTSIGLGATFNWDKEVIKETVNKSTNYDSYITVVGGNKDGLTFKFSPTSPPETTFSSNEWTGSINDSSARLMELDWDYTYPIYDLISDPLKKELLKNAVTRYINNKIVDVVEVLPLFCYYHNSDKKKKHNHFVTTERDVHIRDPHWKLLAIEGHIFKYRETGTVPLYVYYNDSRFDFSTTTHPGIGGQPGWNPGYIIGYIYPNYQNDLSFVKFQEYLHGAGNNHLATTGTEMHLFEGWTWKCVLGYIIRAE